MLQKLFRFIRGYLLLRITGYSPERFLNACSHKKIEIWGLRPVDHGYEFYLSVKAFKNLKPILKKTETKVIILQKFGLPFLLYRKRKRNGFFVGIAGGIFLLYILTLFVWRIDIQGNLTYTEETLLRFLEEHQVKYGSLKTHVDCTKIVMELREEYEDILWVSAHIQGTKLVICVKENEDAIAKSNDQDEEEKTKKAYDLVADVNGKITDMIVRKGTVKMKEGDKVQKGEVLVSGYIPIKNDAGEIVDYQYETADAKIVGISNLTYQDEISQIYIEKKIQNIQKQEYELLIGNYRISLGGIKNNYSAFEMESRQYPLKITDQFSLPVFLVCRKAIPYQPVEKSYTETEVQTLLSERFDYYCKDLEKKGVEILQNNVKIYRGSHVATAKGTLVVRQEIGVLKASNPKELQVENEQSGDLIDGNDGNSH